MVSALEQAHAALGPKPTGWRPDTGRFGRGGRGSLSRQLTFRLPVNEKEPTLGRAEQASGQREQHVRRSWGRRSLASSRKCQDPVRLEVGSGEGGRGGEGRQEPDQSGPVGPCRELGFVLSAMGRFMEENCTIRFPFKEKSLSCCAGASRS